MRALAFQVLAVAFTACIGATGCSVQQVERPRDLAPETMPAEPPVTDEEEIAAPPAPPPEKVAPTGSVADTVVHLFMHDYRTGDWYCTGTLVSETTVVTAAHCIDPDRFQSYAIVLTTPEATRIKATSPRMFGGVYTDVANPDLGTLTLSTPVVLGMYAELTDVTSKIEAGESVMGAAIVRVSEVPSSSMAATNPMPVSSTVQFGYEYGFGTPMFSKGGDSGAGLFLVENGKITNKLIGVARQPEPSRELDHFTRIDAEVLAWAVAAD